MTTPEDSFQKLAMRIIELKNKHRQKVIGIDGGGGAGKSTFANELAKSLPQTAVIHIDDFYTGPWDRRSDHKNYDAHPLFDWERFVREVVEPIQNGNPITYHIYNWHADNTDAQASVPADAFIIIEGGYTTQKRFADLYDFKIWVEADEATRLKKALIRDGEHMRFMWEEEWLPIERNYIRIQNPASRADLVVRGQTGDFTKGTFQTI